MGRHRTTAVLLALAGFAAAVFATTASGREGGSVPRLVFPLVAKTELWDNYGDARPNGRHAGIDLENPWRAPVVAVEDGSVKYWDSGLGGCMLYLYGVSGTTYMYIHLNNDLTARNDNRGGCVQDVSFAVSNGARVTAGQQIAWNGDSGDADGNPHLHFEVHPNGGADIDPFRYLKRAVKPLFASRVGSVFSLALDGQLVAAGAGSATVRIDRVRKYPGGSWLDVEARAVELTVPLGTDVTPFAQLASATSRPLRKPAHVTAYTLKGKATSRAIVGAPGELLLARMAPTP